MKAQKIADITLNLLIVLFTGLGIFIMLTNKNTDGLLQSHGAENFKYFTVLSNTLCGIVALVNLVMELSIKSSPTWLRCLRLMTAAAVAVTFSVVAFMFGPLYGYSNMYNDANLEFHLIVPVIAIIDICIADLRLPFRANLLSGIAELLYGTGYLLNILINGKGEWPDTNDFYGFMNWGFGVSMIIFAAIVAFGIGFSSLLWAVNRKLTKTT